MTNKTIFFFLKYLTINDSLIQGNIVILELKPANFRSVCNGLSHFRTKQC